MIDNNDYLDYETDDIYLAAYFMVSGCTYKGKKINGKKVIFIFENIGGSIKTLKSDYYSGVCKVKPYDYAQQVIAMKQLLFD